MKKTLVSLSLATLASTSFAMTSGGYMGLSAGLQSFIPKTTITDIDADGTDALSIAEGSSDFSGGVFIGYNYLFNDQYGLGLHMDAQLINPKTTIKNIDQDINGTSTQTITTKLKDNLGISVRSSMVMNDSTTGSLILGYRRASTQYSVGETGSDTIAASTSKKINSNGFEYGLGTEVQLSEEVALRLEATQTLYGSQTPFQSATHGSFKSSLKVNQANLSILWYPNWI